ncbi:unnamed protein product [Ceratitis capitata]|uniref:NADPH:adrenodoxin oxidoreductase, mitochondrial n=1 Tax=Ceratitis capitata TaxID=7213 RepID=A0A811VGL0_CERCA|nr:unnamed protein product [Ceratitis capitata]
MFLPKKVLLSTITKQCCLHTNKKEFSAGVAVNSPTKRICIVGAGPAGFYAAQYILKTLSDCVVDVIEKLPVPFGLVRFGVAPDHPEVKNVINTFNKTAEHKNFNFFGNVTLGKDISLQELRERYHAVLLTYGADQDRELNIPNENQPNVLSARKFVAWYNGLPGEQDLNPNLSGRSVAILGQGNVAVDAARMLLSSVDALRKTDTTEYALEALSRSKVEQVYLVGRRGPLQAAFTIKELREMLKLPNVQTIWKPDDFTDVPAHLPNLPRPRKRLTELMLKSLSEQSSSSSSNRAQRPIPTDKIDHLPAELILRSIGYKSTCVDGGICFDDRGGRVFNESGRVLKDATSKSVDKGLYVAGWLGTGPTGVILTTMNGAFGVAKTLCDDIISNEVDTSSSKAGSEAKQYGRVVTWSHWHRINQAEIKAGERLGKPREKL